MIRESYQIPDVLHLLPRIGSVYRTRCDGSQVISGSGGIYWPDDEDWEISLTNRPGTGSERDPVVLQ